MKYIKKLKLNESETSYADSQFILRKYLSISKSSLYI